MGRYYNRNSQEVETWNEIPDASLLKPIYENIINGDITVATVFLGFNVGTDDEPRIFETAVYGGYYDGERETYFEESAASKGHAKWVATASEPLPKAVEELGDMIADTQETNPYKIAQRLLETERIHIKNE